MTALQKAHKGQRDAAGYKAGGSPTSVLGTLGLAAAVTVILAPSGAAAAAACRAVPQSIPHSRLVVSGARLKVHVGAIVYALLVEPGKFAGSNRGFPWSSPTASLPKTLTSVRLCKQTGASSLPTSVVAFRASRPGAAVVSAPLTKSWRGVSNRPHAFRAVVTVIR